MCLLPLIGFQKPSKIHDTLISNSLHSVFIICTYTGGIINKYSIYLGDKLLCKKESNLNTKAFSIYKHTMTCPPLMRPVKQASAGPRIPGCQGDC